MVRRERGSRLLLEVVGSKMMATPEGAGNMGRRERSLTLEDQEDGFKGIFHFWGCWGGGRLSRRRV
jgi:hypothetical protein